jgi:hypothetical protein
MEISGAFQRTEFMICNSALSLPPRDAAMQFDQLNRHEFITLIGVVTWSVLPDNHIRA